MQVIYSLIVIIILIVLRQSVFLSDNLSARFTTDHFCLGTRM